MALWLNTYGTPDGGNIWQGERNTFILKRFNVYPWMCKACLMDQCMYYVAYTTTEPVPESEAAEAKERSGGVPEFQKQLYRGTDSKRMSKGGFRVHEVWYVVWTDDFDGVGTSVPLMEEIMNACNGGWAVKQTSNECMVGVRRKLTMHPTSRTHRAVYANTDSTYAWQRGHWFHTGHS